MALVSWALGTMCGRRLVRWAGDTLSRQLPWHPLRQRAMLQRWEESAVSLVVHAWFAWQGAGLLRQGTARAAQLAFMQQQLCNWIVVAAYCMCIDAKRKDHTQMVLHHAVTLGLIGGCLATDALSVGVLVVFLHDATDLLVELTKLSHYLDLHGPTRGYVAEICFVINLGVWVAVRNVYFTLSVVPHFTQHARSMAEMLLAAGLWALALMHALWLRMFLDILPKLGQGRQAGSDYEQYERQTKKMDVA